MAGGGWVLSDGLEGNEGLKGSDGLERNVVAPEYHSIVGSRWTLHLMLRGPNINEDLYLVSNEKSAPSLSRVSVALLSRVIVTLSNDHLCS